MNGTMLLKSATKSLCNNSSLLLWTMRLHNLVLFAAKQVLLLHVVVLAVCLSAIVGGEVIVDRFYKSVAPLDVSTFSS